MRRLLLLLSFLSLTSFAQTDSTFVDDKYLEDQLYFNLTYIHMLNLPNQIKQSGFSFGLGAGFIKDLPLNEERNIGLGAGIGYGWNNYYFNVVFDAVEPTDETIKINNKVIMHTVELPIELRFRGSTPNKYKFWRVYPGFKIAYVFHKNTSFGKTPDFDVDDIVDHSEFLYGVTLGAGYNKWNLYMYYGLNALLSNTDSYEENFSINDFRIGLIFYIF